MKPTHRYGLLPNLDLCGVLGILLTIIFVSAIIWNLGAQAAYWMVGFLP